MYEYVIYCLKCQSHSSQGGFRSPVTLSDEDVLVKAMHNPACSIPHLDQINMQRAASEEPPFHTHVVTSPGNEPSVTMYQIDVVL